MKCSNCGSKLTCGCQKRVATDGRQCCSQCVANYNNSLKKAVPQVGGNIAASINKISLQR